jgi:hypothetical protein
MASLCSYVSFTSRAEHHCSNTRAFDKAEADISDAHEQRRPSSLKRRGAAFEDPRQER